PLALRDADACVGGRVGPEARALRHLPAGHAAGDAGRRARDQLRPAVRPPRAEVRRDLRAREPGGGADRGVRPRPDARLRRGDLTAGSLEGLRRGGMPIERPYVSPRIGVLTDAIGGFVSGASRPEVWAANGPGVSNFMFGNPHDMAPRRYVDAL